MRFHVASAAAFLAQLPAVDGLMFRDGQSPSEAHRCDPAYVSVFSRRDGAERREHIRKLWQDAGSGWGDVVAQFALCQPGADEPPSVAEALAAEAQVYNDILVMDCEDGYLHGALTKKVQAAMQVFLNDHSHRSYFMKTDDDTFARMGGICGVLSWREKRHRNNRNLYMGVFAEGAENMETKHPPVRDPKSAWYESEERFPGKFYPKSAKGGPGYLLSTDLVKQIIEGGIAASNTLSNEDKAVGVWVDKLIQRGLNVSMLNIPGTDGYEEHKKFTVTTGQYGDYPFLLHHHLSGKTIECLHAIHMKMNFEEHIDGCFRHLD